MVVLSCKRSFSFEKTSAKDAKFYVEIILPLMLTGGRDVVGIAVVVVVFEVVVVWLDGAEVVVFAAAAVVVVFDVVVDVVVVVDVDVDVVCDKTRDVKKARTTKEAKIFFMLNFNGFSSQRINFAIWNKSLPSQTNWRFRNCDGRLRNGIG